MLEHAREQQKKEVKDARQESKRNLPEMQKAELEKAKVDEGKSDRQKSDDRFKRNKPLSHGSRENRIQSGINKPFMDRKSGTSDMGAHGKDAPGRKIVANNVLSEMKQQPKPNLPKSEKGEGEKLEKPYRSEAQRRWAHTESGKKALGGEAGVHEWDESSKGKKLPEKVGKTETDVIEALKKDAIPRIASPQPPNATNMGNIPRISTVQQPSPNNTAGIPKITTVKSLAKDSAKENPINDGVAMGSTTDLLARNDKNQKSEDPVLNMLGRLKKGFFLS